MYTTTNAGVVQAARLGRDARNSRGTMSTDAYRAGFTRSGAPYVGYLPERLRAILDARFREGAVVQVIYSYNTPIAWLDAGCWVIPEVRYSTTTSSKHQSPLWVLRGEYIPADAGLDEYMQVLNGATRYAFHGMGARRRSYRGTGVQS